MNATAWMLLVQVAFTLLWAGYFILFGPSDLTISATLRKGGPWLALAIIIGFSVLMWHVWIQHKDQWPWGAAR